MNTSTKLMAAGAAASLSMADVEIGGGKTAADGEEGEEAKPKPNLFGYIMYCVALACGVMSVGAMAIETSVVMYVAGGFGILMSIVALIQQNALNKEDAFRQVHNMLRVEVNRLQEQNNILSTDIDNLEGKVGQLQSCEDGLERICSQQSTAVTTLVNCVKENQIILDEMEALVKQQLMGQIISTIITSDKDGNFIIDDHELDELIIRINAFDPVESVNEQGLRDMLRGQNLNFVITKAKSFISEPEKGQHLIQLSTMDKLTSSSVDTIPYTSP